MQSIRAFLAFAGLALLAAALDAGCGGRAAPLSDGTEGITEIGAPHLLDGRSLSDGSEPGEGGAASLTFVAILGGTFAMGSSSTEHCRLSNETQHSVTLTYLFEIGATEVTQGEYAAFTGHSPSSFASCGSKCPVDSVTWSHAVAFCNLLSKKKGISTCYTCSSKTGQYEYPYDCKVATEFDTTKNPITKCKGYRLPVEAEWELAYRAGTTTSFPGGDPKSCTQDTIADAVAWTSKNSGGTPHPVAGKSPNAWGLYDMAGNLWEWTSDWYVADLGSAAVLNPVGAASGTERVIRGGSFSAGAASSRAASRNQVAPGQGLPILGFRCARTL
jgi:formylglycine-generating enzyme required for sulfatase activity